MSPGRRANPAKPRQKEKVERLVAEEIHRRIDEDPAYLRGLSERTLLQLANMSRRSSIATRPARRGPAGTLPARVLEADESSGDANVAIAREILEMKTVIVITQGIVDPANANFRSLNSYWDNEDTPGWLDSPSLPAEWHLGTHLVEYHGPFNATCGWYVVDGPPSTSIRVRRGGRSSPGQTTMLPEPEINPIPPVLPRRIQTAVDAPSIRRDCFDSSELRSLHGRNSFRTASSRS